MPEISRPRIGANGETLERKRRSWFLIAPRVSEAVGARLIHQSALNRRRGPRFLKQRGHARLSTSEACVGMSEICWSRTCAIPRDGGFALRKPPYGSAWEHGLPCVVSVLAV